MAGSILPAKAVRAQNDVGESEAQQIAPAEPPSNGESDAVTVGPFLVNPAVTLSQGYEDNVFTTRNDRVGDFIAVLSPALNLELDTDAHGLSFGGGADIARYYRNDDESYEDYWFFGDGRYDISARSNVFGGARYTFDHEDRASPDDVAGAEPTRFQDAQAYAGSFNQIGDVSTRVGVTFQRLNFDDVAGGPGVTINNDDRDRDLYEVGARIGYPITPGIEALAQGAVDVRRYKLGTDDAGFDRDSAGFNAGAGARVRFGANVDGEVLLGIIHQDYTGAGLETVTVPDFGARLRWRPATNTTVQGLLDRTVEETTLVGASSYLSTTLAIAVDRALRPDLQASLDISYTENDYQGVGRVDYLIGAGIGVRYFFHPNVFLGTDFRFQRRESSAFGADYDNSQMFVRLGSSLQPQFANGSRYVADNAALPLSSVGGFYVGIQGGYGELFTALDGPRGNGGNLTADFGDHGGTAGGFGGYEIEIDRWNLALELAGETSNADWDHARTPGGRIFSVEKGLTVGGALRVGRRLASGALVYGRGGAVGTQFTTRYETGGTVIDQEDTVPGFRFGGGVEVPLGRQLFWRLDYTYTAYHDYDIELPGSADNFANSETLMRTGLGYRLGGPALAEVDEAAIDHAFAGFYGGASAGYNSLNSQNGGPRQAGSVLSVDRGGHGATGGGFLGYGYTIASLYFGLEADLEVSDANWNIQRDPNGRVYSVEKKWGFGASGRAGYVLGNRALFYGRAGAVRTRFNSEYAFRGNMIDQDDTLSGLRVGGGIEVAAADQVFARFEYTYTDYEDYSLNYVVGTDSFDTGEGLFRVGLGYRF